MERISKTDYYLGIAEEVAKRSTCLRRQYGAVIVKNDEIISTGYNGAARGMTNCCDVGECWREANNIPHGTQYEACVAVHAEQNAIVNADPGKMQGATIYIVGFNADGSLASGKPCLLCRRMLRNAMIKEAVYRDPDGSIVCIAPKDITD